MYMAPEAILERPQNEKVDIWSVGVTIFKLLNSDDDDKYPIYPGTDEYEDFENFFKKLVHKKHYEIPESMFREESKPSELCMDFLKQCFTVDRSKRPSA